MIPIFVIIYLVIGIIFGTLMENSGEPDIIEENGLVRGLFIVVITLLWLPYFIVNACFSRRDIWFRKNYE